jgi:hypothetical protein
MNLDDLIDALQQDLAATAAVGGDEAAQVGRRLSEALGSALRLRLFDALGEAASELSARLPSGHIEVRLSGRDPELVFVEDAGEPALTGDDATARISLRLPEALKASVEKAAANEGVSVNSWLIRAIARGVESRPRHGRRLTGYGQS